MAETSDQENNTAIANQEPMKDAHADDHKDMDDIDTDDLLDEAELSLKSTHWTATKTTTTSSRRKGKGTATSTTTTTSRRRKGAAKSTEDMDIDDSESETGGGSNKRSSRSKKAKGKQKVRRKRDSVFWFMALTCFLVYSQRWLHLIRITPKSWLKSIPIPIGSSTPMPDIK